MAMTPVLHKECGGQIGWFKERLTHGALVLSSNFVRMDGTSPKAHSILHESCDRCGGVVTSTLGMEQAA